MINFSFPLTVEDYVHRIGRTGMYSRIILTSHSLLYLCTITLTHIPTPSPPYPLHIYSNPPFPFGAPH
ncbi:hypothetical protein EON64_08250 [archaeon]|nr:MAG: hypothetical protein EON64_08250 [archaeon]